MTGGGIFNPTRNVLTVNTDWVTDADGYFTIYGATNASYYATGSINNILVMRISNPNNVTYAPSLSVFVRKGATIKYTEGNGTGSAYFTRYID